MLMPISSHRSVAIDRGGAPSPSPTTGPEGHESSAAS